MYKCTLQKHDVDTERAVVYCGVVHCGGGGGGASAMFMLTCCGVPRCCGGGTPGTNGNPAVAGCLAAAPPPCDAWAPTVTPLALPTYIDVVGEVIFGDRGVQTTQ
jgi:hypothetical protein